VWDAGKPDEDADNDAPAGADARATGGAESGSSGSSGSAGSVGSAGRSGTESAAGATGSDAGGTGGIEGTAGVAGTSGQAGQDGGSKDAPDAALAPDSSLPDAPCALCGLASALVHRYTFEGTGTKLTDSVGIAHGTVVNTQLSGTGTLVLGGGSSGQYVDLPDHLLSPLGSATIELWITWYGGASNQRILDFGSNVTSSGKLQASSSVLISPNSAPDGISPRLRVSYSNQISHSGTFVDATSSLPTGEMKQVVAVLDGGSRTLSLYLDGAFQGQTGGLEALSRINDVNDWIGKSQYSDDPGFSGLYDEIRIYDAPLTAEQIKAVFAAGPKASFN
jgi:hypothetical protein